MIIDQIEAVKKQCIGEGMTPRFIYIAPFELVGMAEVCGMRIIRDPTCPPTNFYVTETEYETDL